jgi:hypothetical protein
MTSGVQNLSVWKVIKQVNALSALNGCINGYDRVNISIKLQINLLRKPTNS